MKISSELIVIFPVIHAAIPTYVTIIVHAWQMKFFPMDTSVNVQQTIPEIIVKSMIEHAKITPVGEYIDGNSIPSKEDHLGMMEPVKKCRQLLP